MTAHPRNLVDGNVDPGKSLHRGRAPGGLFPPETEIARRLGQSPAEWAAKALILERDGLPRVDPLMGARYWPAVVAYFSRRYGIANLSPSQPDGEENLDVLR